MATPITARARDSALVDPPHPPIRLVLVGVSVRLGGLLHHPQHGEAAGADEAPDERGGEGEEDDVEDGRVVPGDARPRSTLALRSVGIKPERVEGELDGEARRAAMAA